MAKLSDSMAALPSIYPEVILSERFKRSQSRAQKPAKKNVIYSSNESIKSSEKQAVVSKGRSSEAEVVNSRKSRISALEPDTINTRQTRNYTFKAENSIIRKPRISTLKTESPNPRKGRNSALETEIKIKKMLDSAQILPIQEVPQDVDVNPFPLGPYSGFNPSKLDQKHGELSPVILAKYNAYQKLDALLIGKVQQSQQRATLFLKEEHARKYDIIKAARKQWKLLHSHNSFLRECRQGPNEESLQRKQCYIHSKGASGAQKRISEKLQMISNMRVLFA